MTCWDDGKYTLFADFTRGVVLAVLLGVRRLSHGDVADGGVARGPHEAGGRVHINLSARLGRRELRLQVRPHRRAAV